MAVSRAQAAKTVNRINAFNKFVEDTFLTENAKIEVLEKASMQTLNRTVNQALGNFQAGTL